MFPKKFLCLISCKLKAAVFRGFVIIFSKFSYFALAFGIKTNLAISEPDDDTIFFSEKCINLKQAYCFVKVHWSVKIS